MMVFNHILSTTLAYTSRAVCAHIVRYLTTEIIGMIFGAELRARI